MKKNNLFEQITRTKKMMGLLTESIVPAGSLKNLISGAAQTLINNMDTVLQRKFPTAFAKSVTQMTEDELKTAVRALGRGGVKKFLTIAIDEKVLNAKTIGEELFTNQPGSNQIVAAIGRGVDVEDILRGNPQITEDLPQDVIDWWMYNCRKRAFPSQNVPSPDDIAAQNQTGNLNLNPNTSNLDDMEQYIKARSGNPKFVQFVRELDDSSLWGDLTPQQKKILLYDVEKNPGLLTMGYGEQKQYLKSLLEQLKNKPTGISKRWSEFLQRPIENQIFKITKVIGYGAVGTSAIILSITFLRGALGLNDFFNKIGGKIGYWMDKVAGPDEEDITNSDGGNQQGGGQKRRGKYD